MYIYETKIGKITIMDNGIGITDINFTNENLPPGCKQIETNLIREAKHQLDEYLKANRKSFDIALSLTGTDFQKNVWNALMAIPYGETKSYSEIAEDIGNPKACRAVGLANNRNPILIIIPCHRVIGKNGKLVGYGGGLDIKEKLLNLENNFK